MILAALARGLIRWRWVIIALWALIGAVAFVQAPKTPDRLALRGGASEFMEARVADRMLEERFAKPFGEFFAVTLEGPSSFNDTPSRDVLDTLTSAAKRLPFVENVVSHLTRGDSLFLSRDGRATFFLVSVSQSKDSGAAFVKQLRGELSRVVARIPNRPAYRMNVTGRSALDLDVRTVSADDSRRLELKLLPVTLVILVLAFGALIAALL